MIPHGTLLNTATVAVGGLIGWLIGSALPPSYSNVVFGGLGIVTVGIGMKMLLGARNILVVAAAIALGGVMGHALGIQNGVENLAETIKRLIGATHDTGFVDVMVATSVLFCVGPMTLLGCMQDKLERKIELLSLKSTMDGFASIFFGTVSGPAVIATAGVVLIFQTILTHAASPLRPIAEDDEMLADLSGAGGVMLVGTGIGLLVLNRDPAFQTLKLPVSDYLPALVLAPLFVGLGRRFRRRKESA